MNINKQRILAILIVFVICFSIISPITVHAVVNYTQTGTKMTPDEWRLGTFNGPNYKIQYYYPVYNGVEFKYFIFSNSILPNVTYFTENTVFENNSLNRVLQGEAITYSAQQAGWFAEGYDNRIKNVMTTALFETHYASGEFTHYINASGTTVCTMMESSKVKEQHIAYLPSGKTYNVVTSSGTIPAISAEESEAFYVNWYLTKYGTNPPPAETIPDVEYMIGNYYAILQQPIMKYNNDSAREDNDGFVETVGEARMYSDNGTNIYVVISSEGTGDIINYKFLDDPLNLKGALANFAFFINPFEMYRNNYMVDFLEPGYIWYDSEAKLNRYYFSNLTDACKFVLYGTAGAEPIHKEIGATDYGYGYTDCMYNNYDIRYYGTNPIPTHQYPLDKMRIILRWHNEDVHEREYLMIDMNYIPYGVLIDTVVRNQLLIPNKLYPTFSRAWKIDGENSDTFDPFDPLLYEETDVYDNKTNHRFQLYYPQLEEKYVSNSWDIIYSTHSIYGIKKDGNTYSAGDLSEDPIIETKTTADGKKYIINHLLDKAYVYASENEYTDEDGDGIYYDPITGDTIDDNTATSDHDEYLKTLIKYTDGLEKVTHIINKLSGILDEAINETKPLTDLLNRVFAQFPTIFKNIIIMMIFAIILKRAVKRGE